jgi:tRNA-splicing ligase RtcB (3'-phosphate/5'-hydroxy nucleic acid ligase)
MQTFEVDGGRHVKAWVDGVPFEDAARKQVENVARMPFVHSHVAIMPDVHWGMGATVGSVIATKGAIIPAAVGVDIGCGMVAARLQLTADQLPDSLAAMRSAIEAAVPHGRTDNGGANDRGAWGRDATRWPLRVWCDDSRGASLEQRFNLLVEKHPKIGQSNNVGHLGTLGTGNHFIEVCLDESDGVWVMLHSGSRGVGGRIGSYFIALAKEDMRRHFINLPDMDLAYLAEGTQHFAEYVEAVGWAQDFAMANRRLMLDATIGAIDATLGRGGLTAVITEVVSCHHNYVSREHHFGEDVLVTRKGAVRARAGELGIIPGSMGARSYIVRGKGNRDSFDSCSHGAGRAMSRTEAKKRFTVEDHEAATLGVECRKDIDVVDETPGAYKSIDAVMAAQTDLVDVVHTLKQVLCVKG